jgi:hypothetical protein
VSVNNTLKKLVIGPVVAVMFYLFADDNFDLPDRTFHSLHTAWRLTSSDSTTDVKELIPEFFFLPEFLRNSEGMILKNFCSSLFALCLSFLATAPHIF